MLRTPVLLALLVLFAAACGSDSTGPPFCGATVGDVSATSGTAPVFAWEPSCRTRALRVFRVSDQQTMWSISSGSSPAVPSGVRYGTTPRGATAAAAALPLVPGTQYRVIISNNGTMIDAGVNFTP